MSKSLKNSALFRTSPEVQQALQTRQPVVALETTIYTHGFPYPDNAALALRLESLVRENGGVPATIGILDGVARVGLTSKELEFLASTAGKKETMKISRRDLGFALGLRDAEGKRFNGGTTIAGTMVLAHMAGIKVFATGGLGGVHRGAESTMDVSADLTELGRTPVAVISSGCKAFLDLPKTLEYLETQGVAVATFLDGRDHGSVDFPAFWTRESGVPSPNILRDETEAAQVIHAHHQLGLQSGLHFANPIPHEHSLPRDVMEAGIYEAISLANAAGAVGAAATPYILAKIRELSGEKSVHANRALVESNVIRGTKVAVELRALEMESARDDDDSGQVIGPGSGNFSKQGVSRGVSSASLSQSRSKASVPELASATAMMRPNSTAVAEAPSTAIEEAPTKAVEQAPTTALEKAPTMAIKEAPTTSIQEAPTVAIDEARTTAIGEAPTTAISEAASTSVAQPQPTSIEHAPSTSLESKANVFVAGSLAIDLSCDYKPPSCNRSEAQQPELHTSNPASITQSLGGVASNVARAAHLMGANVRLCAAIGDDLGGKNVLQSLDDLGMDTSSVRTLNSGNTVRYVAVNDSKRELMLGMADMSIVESTETGPGSVHEAFESFWLPQLKELRPSHLVLDSTWPIPLIIRWLEAGKEVNAHITWEPVSNAKGPRIFHLPKTNQLSVYPNPSIHLTTPNSYELTAMHTHARESGAFDRADWWEVIDALGIPSSGARTQLALAASSELVDQGIPQQSIQLLPFIPSICTKLGPQGVLLTQLIPAGDERLRSGEYGPYILSRCVNGTEETLGVGGVYMRLFPAVEDVEAKDVVSVKGVGDTFAGTLVAGLASRIVDGKAEGRVEDLIDLAQRAAVLTLKSKESVSAGLGTLRILM